jgi:transcriptional regulator with XRE-family HTH domain
MGRAEVLRERVRNEQRLLERLQTANIRFADAQLERLWAIKSAHELGLSIRQIAAATGVSSSRIHQVLNSEDPTQIPIWATDLRDAAEDGKKKRLAAEVKLLRQCTHWLKQLEDGEEVSVNLRPDADPETEYVRFDRHRVIRVLERIAADLDQLTQGQPTEVEGDALNEHKRRLAEPPKVQRRLSTREARNTLRAEINLPPT